MNVLHDIGCKYNIWLHVTKGLFSILCRPLNNKKRSEKTHNIQFQKGVFELYFLGWIYLPQPVKRWLPAPWRFCWPAPLARRAGRFGWGEPGWTEGCWTDGASQRTKLNELCRKLCNFVSQTVCSGCPRCWRGSEACWSWQEAASGPADFASCFPLHHIWPLLWMSSLVVRRVCKGLRWNIQRLKTSDAIEEKKSHNSWEV